MPAKPVRDPHETSPFTLSLRIKHPSIDPQIITDELQLTPEHAWACGEPRTSDAGAVLGGKRRNSYWSAALPPMSRSELLSAILEPHHHAPTAATPESIRKLAELGMSSFPKTPPAPPSALSQHLFAQLLLLKRRRPFFDRLEKEGGEVSLSIEIDVSDGVSFTLEPALGRLVGDLGLQLDFEFV
jgi:hypothetical protein